MNKLTIAVIFGGCSSEYRVSLESAHAVLSHMDKERYIPVMIGISRQGDWFYYQGDVEKIAGDTWCNETDCIPAAVSLERRVHNLLILEKDGVRKLPIDVAFPVLHGKNGEDGTVQALFELAGIPVAGCGLLASALCMDKDRAHKLVSTAGVAVPAAFVLKKETEMKEVLKQAEQIGYPLFVKPVKAGSSFGVTKVTDRTELPAAVTLAFEYDDTVIVEENIDGFEVGCANEELRVGEVDEIELTEGFFDFTEKYSLKTSAIHVPARIDGGMAKQIRETAKIIYKTLDCRGFARVDMFLTTSGEIIFNEVNTIPGFTSHSRYPNMMKAAGMSFEQIISGIIELAAEPDIRQDSQKS